MACGTHSGRAASPIRSRGSRKPPISCSCVGWTRRTPARRTRLIGLKSRSNGASSRRARTRSASGGVAYEDMRWSKLKNKDPGTMFEIVSEHVFPFLRNMAEADTAHATHMKGARFTIPTPALLTKVVDLLAEIPMEDRDTKGDLYEYMLSKIATAGQNGQFRTPRHIIALMVDMMAPGPKDVVWDHDRGTGGFLVAAGEYLRDNHPKLFHDKKSRDHFNEEMFHGFDFAGTMLRIGSMN